MRSELTIGVDVGGTSLRAGVVDAGGSVLDQRTTPTPDGDDALEGAVAATVDQLVAAHPGLTVGAVGLAVAGFVAPDRSRIWFSPHLSWRGVPVADRMRRRIGLPVVLEHDANAAAVAEHRFGAARGQGVTAMVLLGTGIGGALLIGGEVFRGAHGVAPELGHLRVVPDGRPCACGKRGCWERYCSGTALAATALELLAGWQGLPGPLASHVGADPGRLSGRKVAAAATAGDPVALRAMGELSRWLGEGMAIIADVYDPELIVVGGAVSESAALFLDDAREHYARTATGARHRPLARIRTAQLGGQAGIVGAAVLAREVIGCSQGTANPESDHR